MPGDVAVEYLRPFPALDDSAPIAPDGICADEQGAVWLADPIGRRAVRVLDGGAITDVLEFDEMPVACVSSRSSRSSSSWAL